MNNGPYLLTKGDHPPRGLKMKVALFILVVLPLVFCAPSEIDRRWLIDVHAVVDQLKHLITPDMTESACTTVCESVISGIGLLVCPSACNICDN
uniref:Uncharacterized protein n=1 Tax=Magallana gigas TaxID=29159 RepID=K1PUB8_MAGGI